MFLYPEASQENFKSSESSQETPKETAKGVQNLVKKWLKSEPKNEQNELQTTMAYLKKIALTGVLWEAFLRAWGLLKTLTSKMSSRCQKIAQDA